MLEHNELTQDEQLYPGLTKQLQENYPINQADQQSLQRIRARLQQTRLLTGQQNNYQENIRTGQFVLPPAQRPGSWRWRIGVLAALLLITLLVGTFIALKSNNPPMTGITPIEKPGDTPVVPMKNQPSLIQINMKSPTTGWGEAMSTADGSLPHRVIVRTIDGGRSWNESQLPGSYTSFITSFFLDETTAWVIPGSSQDTSGTPLLRTLDGGKSWQKFMIPGETSEITFVDKQNGWATDVLQKGQTAMDQELAIFHTKDGGKSWQFMSKAQTGATNTTPGPFPTGEVGQATFLNARTGWFVRGSILIANHGSAYKALYITQDSGKSWQVQQLPQVDEIMPAPTSDSGDKVIVTISQPRFFDAQHGNLFVYVNDQGKIHIYFYNTGDGGQTWQLTGDKFSKVVNNNAMGPTGVILIDATHFLLIEKNEIDIYELTGGQWQEKYKMTTGNEFNNFSDVNFINEHVGWFVAEKATIVNKKTNDQTFTSLIYFTNNGGKSWQEIQQSSYVEPGNLSGG